MFKLIPILILCLMLQSLYAKDEATSAASHNSKGIEAARNENYPEALDNFARAANIQDAEASRTYNNMGYAYELKGDNLKAIEAYRKAIARNPNLVPSIQNLGKLLYYGGQYNEAILYGEKVLQLDQQNPNVGKWLPDAYRKQTEQRLFALKNRQQNLDPEKKKMPFAKKKKPKRNYNYEVGYKIDYIENYDKDRERFITQHQAGPIRIPMGLFANLWPSETFHLFLEGGVPYLGAIQPPFLDSRERVEATYHFKTVYFGAGLLFNAADLAPGNVPTRGGDVYFRKNLDYAHVSDVKAGLIFGFKNRQGANLKIAVYPRYAIRDLDNQPKGVSMDAAYWEFLYHSKAFYIGGQKTKHTWPLFIDFGFTIDEIYLTEFHTDNVGTKLGSYFGTYDIKLGFEIGEIKPMFNKIPITFGFTFIERLYFQSLANSNPRAFGNGQGYFGLDIQGALKGSTFSGFKSNSQIVQLHSRQLYFNKVHVKESIQFEATAAKEKFNPLHLGLEVSIRF